MSWYDEARELESQALEGEVQRPATPIAPVEEVVRLARREPDPSIDGGGEDTPTDA